MLILHVFDHSLPLQSGYVYRSLGILGAQRGFGWRTLQLTTPRHNAGAPPVELVDGWSFHRTPKPPALFARLPVLRELAEIAAVEARIRELVREYRPDIIHAHSPALAGIPACRAARSAGIPFVYEVRALWEDAAVDLGHTTERGFRYRAGRALEGKLLRRAGAVVTLCEPLRQEFISRGIDPAKIAVVPNAVDLAHFSGERQRDEALSERLGLKGRLVLGFIGSFYRYEGLDLLIEAFASIRARLPHAVLLLVGGGPEEQRLRQLSASLNLENGVIFTGRVPHADVRAYYDLVELFVYPRRSIRLTELVTPIKPLEAMAERRIVMASDVGGHRALIRDGITGFLFRADDSSALADRVVEAASQPGALAEMREAGRRFIEQERTWAASAFHYRNVYETLLQRRRSAVNA